jgi:hypothetical protein
VGNKTVVIVGKKTVIIVDKKTVVIVDKKAEVPLVLVRPSSRLPMVTTNL